MSEQNNKSTQQLEELEKVYVRAEHWVSDDEFYADEVAFLINLTDKYFIGIIMSDAEVSVKLKEAANRLFKLDEYRVSLATQNKEHKAYLARIIQNKELFDPEEYKDRQADVEGEQTEFLKNYRAVKKDIFKLSEQLLESARSQRLIGS